MMSQMNFVTSCVATPSPVAFMREPHFLRELLFVVSSFIHPYLMTKPLIRFLDQRATSKIYMYIWILYLNV